MCLFLPELGLESLSRWTAPLGSGVGGDSRSDGASQERVDQRELLPLPDEEWTVPSPELLPESSGLLWQGDTIISEGEGAWKKQNTRQVRAERHGQNQQCFWKKYLNSDNVITTPRLQYFYINHFCERSIVHVKTFAAFILQPLGPENT